MKGLCKKGDDNFNNGYGWLVFLRANKKDNNGITEESRLGIGNKEFICYNNDVLIPFIQKAEQIFDKRKESRFQAESRILVYGNVPQL